MALNRRVTHKDYKWQPVVCIDGTVVGRLGNFARPEPLSESRIASEKDLDITIAQIKASINFYVDELSQLESYRDKVQSQDAGIEWLARLEEEADDG